MSQKFLDFLRVDVAREEQRGAGVPEVVEAHPGHLCLLEERSERPPPEVGRVDERADLAGEHQSRVLVAVAQYRDLFGLAGEMLAQRLDRRLGEIDGGRLFLVFGSPRSKRPPLLVIVRRTLNVAFSRSTSAHFRARSSPCLMPVCTAST